MYGKIKDHLTAELEQIREAGLFKSERIITSSQEAEIELDSGQKVLNFCANNYLGLANHPALVEAAAAAVREHGYGMSSVRFICGTLDVHKELEKKVAEFMGTEEYADFDYSQVPSFMWQTYDWYLDTNAGYFGAKAANQPTMFMQQ